MSDQLKPEEQYLATRCGITVASATRRSDRLYDVSVEGTYQMRGLKNSVKCGAWLPLAGIRELIDWTTPRVASMSSHERMALDGDWSGIRDSDNEKIWAIFSLFVVPLVRLPCEVTLKRKKAPKVDVALDLLREIVALIDAGLNVDGESSVIQQARTAINKLS